MNHWTILIAIICLFLFLFWYNVLIPITFSEVFFLVSSVPSYRAFFEITLVVWGFTLNLWFIESFNINVDVLLSINCPNDSENSHCPQKMSSITVDTMNGAIWLSVFFLIFLLLRSPFLLYIILFLFLINPWPPFKNSRYSLIRLLFDCIISPFGPTCFVHIVFTDILTSLFRAFGDIYEAIFFVALEKKESSSFFDAKLPPSQTRFVVWIFFLIQSLPFLWRFLQCLKLWYNTSTKIHILNACKYLSALPTLAFSALLTADRRPIFGVVLIRNYWAGAMSVYSIYSFLWDICVDWGLWRNFELHQYCPLDLHNSDIVFHDEREKEDGFWNRIGLYSIRSHLLSRVYLIFLIFVNFFLRMIWIYRLIVPNLSQELPAALSFEFAVLECIRRLLWLAPRMELEYLEIEFEKKT